MILAILKVQNFIDRAVLRATSQDVVEFNDDIQQLCADMVETMFAANGVGLAAPQIGRNLNIFVMRTANGLQNDTQEVRIVINPHVVIEIGEDQSTDKEKIEGCLSIPGFIGRVTRFHEVGVIYYDIEGKRHGKALSGFEARIWQHENDHLNGILFPDRAKAMYQVKKA